jgi:hypothetical protein
MRSPYGEEKEFFKYSLFIVFCNRLLTCSVCMLIILVCFNRSCNTQCLLLIEFGAVIMNINENTILSFSSLHLLPTLPPLSCFLSQYLIYCSLTSIRSVAQCFWSWKLAQQLQYEFLVALHFSFCFHL